MKKRILLAIDTNLSPAMQHALITVGAFFERVTPPVYLVLLYVIPLSQITPLQPGFYGQVIPTSPASWQHKQADETLTKARTLLQQQGYAREQIEDMVRVGIPADEIVKVARELHVHWIVLGHRGSSWKQRLRRIFVGSVSRIVIQSAHCPVVLVVAPEHRPQQLIAWYTSAITNYLETHPHTLIVLTPKQVVQQFSTTPDKTPHTTREVKAAHQALEQLAQRGVLFRHDVQGELHYVND